MRAELIDIQVEDHGDDVEISLSGSLSKVQLPAVREKIEMLTKGPGCFFFLNLQRAHFKTTDYLDLFLEVLDSIKAQNSALILIFDSEEQKAYFEKYKNIFEVYESRSAYKNSGIRKQLSQIGVHYGKKTGLRLSPAVAISASILIIGWAITLFLIIAAQGRDIADKQAQIIALQSQKDRYVREIDKLESSIGPLRKIGVLQDTSMLSSFGIIQDWVSYLEYLENSRREK
ncbi:MAG: hypothetical protein IKX42_11330 [Fibrobacter sp.]|jgi:hypothetical protein|nr:hypothetical protein [Fibrobacter sp.]